MTRKQARDAAFKLLYQMQIQRKYPEIFWIFIISSIKAAPGKRVY